MLRNAIGFYRLMATWLLRLAYPPLAQGQTPFVPLPEPAPAQFRALPVRPSATAEFAGAETVMPVCRRIFLRTCANCCYLSGRSKPKPLTALMLSMVQTHLVDFLNMANLMLACAQLCRNTLWTICVS